MTTPHAFPPLPPPAPNPTPSLPLGFFSACWCFSTAHNTTCPFLALVPPTPPPPYSTPTDPSNRFKAHRQARARVSCLSLPACTPLSLRKLLGFPCDPASLPVGPAARSMLYDEENRALLCWASAHGRRTQRASERLIDRRGGASTTPRRRQRRRPSWPSRRTRARSPFPAWFLICCFVSFVSSITSSR